jgi:pheromone shutdown protein TraB
MLSSTVEAPVLLIGVAHVVDLEAPLRKVLADRELDGVALELDEERARQVLQPHPGGGRPGSVPLMLRLWGQLQKRLGESIGSGAGGEMRAAATVAHERRLPIFLIDDPIRETIRRLLASLSVRERVSLLVGGIVGLVIPARVVERQLAEYSEAPGDYLDAVREAYPTVARVLLDDRNEHMAERLRVLRGRGFGRIVAVVGDAHLPGLTAALQRRGIPSETVPLSALRT